jgi:hypothetical protein
METASSSQKLVSIYQTEQCQTLGDYNLNLDWL